MFKVSKHQFDLIIIGSGAAGLMAAISAKESGIQNIAVISKVVPTSSHTVAAKGGINATLGNVTKDDWKWHAYDTIKGSDYLADVDAVEILCSQAKAAILNLEEMGVVFSRNDAGKIAQRAYGGQVSDFGKGDVAYRACYSKDKTGRTILHTLHQQALKAGIKFFSEFFVTDLLMIRDNKCQGCVAVDLNSGEIVILESKMTIIATGGYSQIYQNTTSSLICSGDGSALLFQEGLELQDMEFVQFHPTGISGRGFLITEAARSEGAYLLNSNGERFMKNYAPKMMELASRDIISQAMATEIHAGNGVGDNKDALYLDLRHIDADILKNKLPGVVDLVKSFTGLDVEKDPIPVAPSAHYTMGGIPTDLNCNVLSNQKEICGLMAVGEAACVSVHGANRLGCNSLLDLVVFGKIAGKQAAQKISEIEFLESKDVIAQRISDLEMSFMIPEKDDKNNVSLEELKSNLQANNEKNLAVFRDQNLLLEGQKGLRELFGYFHHYKITNRCLLWNEELVAYFELKNLFLNSLATNFAALNRLESRGAHYRSDYKEVDSDKFFGHSLVKITNHSENNAENKLEFRLKPVRCSSEFPDLNLNFKKREY